MDGTESPSIDITAYRIERKRSLFFIHYKSLHRQCEQKWAELRPLSSNVYIYDGTVLFLTKKVCVLLDQYINPNTLKNDCQNIALKFVDTFVFFLYVLLSGP